MDVMLLGFLYTKAEFKGKEGKCYNVFCGYKLYDVTAPFGSGRNAVINAPIEEVECDKSEYNILNVKRVVVDNLMLPRFQPIDCDLLTFPRYNISGADSYNCVYNPLYMIVTQLGSYVTVVNPTGVSKVCTGNEVISMCNNGVQFTNFILENNKPKMGYIYKVKSNVVLNDNDANYYALIRCVEQFKLMSVYHKNVNTAGESLSDRYEDAYKARFRIIQETGTALQKKNYVVPEVISTFTAITDAYLSNLRVTLAGLFREQAAAKPSLQANDNLKPEKSAVSAKSAASVQVPASETVRGVSDSAHVVVTPKPETVVSSTPVSSTKNSPIAPTVEDSTTSPEEVTPVVEQSEAEIEMPDLGIDTSLLDSIEDAFSNGSAFGDAIQDTSPVDNSESSDIGVQEPILNVSEQANVVPVADSEPIELASEQFTNTLSPESNTTVMTSSLHSDASGFVDDSDAVPAADAINTDYSVTPTLSYQCAAQNSVVLVRRASPWDFNFFAQTDKHTLTTLSDKKCFMRDIVDAFKYEKGNDVTENDVDCFLAATVPEILITPNDVLQINNPWTVRNNSVARMWYLAKEATNVSIELEHVFVAGKAMIISEERTEDNTTLAYNVLYNTGTSFELQKLDFASLVNIQDSILNAKIDGVKVKYSMYGLGASSAPDKPEACYKYTSSPEYQLYGFRDIYGNPKILKNNEISVTYLSSLTNLDLQYIYNWVNDNIFATTMSGRLPDIPVYWTRNTNIDNYDVIYMVSSTNGESSTYNIKKQQAGVGVLNKSRSDTAFEPVAILLNKNIMETHIHYCNTKCKENTFYGYLFGAMLRVAGATTKKSMKEIIALSDKIKDFLGLDIESVDCMSFSSRAGRNNIFTYTSATTTGCSDKFFTGIEIRDVMYVNFSSNDAFVKKCGSKQKAIESKISAAKSPKTVFAISELSDTYRPVLEPLSLYKMFDRGADKYKVALAKIKGRQTQADALCGWIDYFPFDLTKLKIPSMFGEDTQAVAIAEHFETTFRSTGVELFREFLNKTYTTPEKMRQLANSVHSTVINYIDVEDISAIPSDFDYSKFVASSGAGTSKFTKEQIAFAYWCHVVYSNPDAVYNCLRATNSDCVTADDLLGIASFMCLVDAALTDNANIPDEVKNAFEKISNHSLNYAALPDKLKDIYYCCDLYSVMDAVDMREEIPYKCLLGLSVLRHRYHVILSHSLADSEVVALGSFGQKLDKNSGIKNNIVTMLSSSNYGVGRNDAVLLVFAAKIVKLFGYDITTGCDIDFNAIYTNPAYQNAHNAVIDMILGLIEFLCYIKKMPVDTTNITEAELLMGYVPRIANLVNACLTACDYHLANIDPDFLKLISKPDMLTLTRIESKYSDLITCLC